jgi:hypothetical protein
MNQTNRSHSKRAIINAVIHLESRGLQTVHLVFAQKPLFPALCKWLSHNVEISDAIVPTNT